LERGRLGAPEREKGDSREQIKTARKETKETRLKAIDFYNNLLQA